VFKRNLTDPNDLNNMRIKLIKMFIISLLLLGCKPDGNNEIASHSVIEDSIKKKKIKKLIEEELSKQKKGLAINYKVFYDKLIQIDSSDINLKIRHAYSNLHLNDNWAGINEFKNILKKDSKNTEALFGMGIAFYRVNLDSCFNYCEKAIEINPNDNLKIVDLSAMYDEQEMYDRAISTINKAIKNLPKNTGLLIHRGSYKTGALDFEGALKDMEVIPDSHKKDESIYINRAICYLYLKKYKECIEQADIAINIDPNGNSDIYLIRANAKSHLKDNEGTYQDLKKAVDLGNEDAVPAFKKFSEYFRTHKNG
jgi:tetratricopeptide (TPR) repeat protein